MRTPKAATLGALLIGVCTMSNVRQTDLLSQATANNPVTCPVCGGATDHIGRVNRRDVFKCTDSACLMAVGFEILKAPGVSS
jgi:hypothetical protein